MNTIRTRLQAEISRYIIVLDKCLSTCHRDENRVFYVQHLAVAGVMLAEVHEGCSIRPIKALIEAEGRRYAHEALNNYEGDLAISLFNVLAGHVAGIDDRIALD
jgi:hypothetical protein